MASKESTAIKFARTCAEKDKRFAALLKDYRAAVKALEQIRNQVSNGRLCYFGDHTGYTPRISSEQVEAWNEALRSAGQWEK